MPPKKRAWPKMDVFTIEAKKVRRVHVCPMTVEDRIDPKTKNFKQVDTITSSNATQVECHE
jgi:hypothetical protein